MVVKVGGHIFRLTIIPNGQGGFFLILDESPFLLFCVNLSHLFASKLKRPFLSKNMYLDRRIHALVVESLVNQATLNKNNCILEDYKI
jgi:hypothetical protein